MLNKKEKELLQQAFSTPAPKKKQAFLRTLPRQEVTLGTLILSQAAYIRKWAWALSLLVFGMVVWLAQYLETDTIWVLSALMPFAALALILEFGKSAAYGMTELEMTSRFSIRTILLARMVMLGTVQLFGLLLTVPVMGVGLIQNGVYLLVPYLLTTVLGLAAVRRLRGKDGMYVCGSISAFISVLCPMGQYCVPALYEGQNMVLWIVAAVFLMVGLVKEFRKTMNQMEENPLLV